MYDEYPQPLKKKIDAIKDEEIAKALWATKGLQALAAVRLGCSPSTVNKRIHESPYLTAVVIDAKEVRKDRYEEVLDRIIDKEEAVPLMFALKTQCKDRGYGQDAVVIDIKDPVKMLMDQIRSSKNLLEHEKRE
jgi:hypothetical protein